MTAVVSRGSDVSDRAGGGCGPAANPLNMPDSGVAGTLLWLLSGWFDGAAQGPCGDRARDDWPAILALAERTKTIGLLQEGAQARQVALPEEVAARLRAVRDTLLKGNLHNLALTAKVIGVLREAGIEAVAFKGAIRAQQVYGGWGRRRSSDIDLLVAPDSYRHAIAVLKDAHYVPLVRDSSLWWHRDLGESPFLQPGAVMPTIDLHHGLQQPGGPYPRDLAFFLESAVEALPGQVRVPVLSADASLLVTVINYGKCVRAGEPWLSHAHEFRLAETRMSPSDRERFETLARRQGLARLTEEFRLAVLALFGDGAASRKGGLGLDHAMCSALGVSPRRPLARTRHLWNWCDGRGPRRGLAFARAAARILRSTWQERRESRALQQG